MTTPPAPAGPQGPRRRQGRWLAVALMAVAALASSCGGGDEAGDADRLALTDPGHDGEHADSGEPGGDAAGDEAGAQTPSADGDTTPTSEPASTTPTTEGSGLAPVTTIAAPSGGDPASIYRGVLGGLDPDEQVAAPATEPPAATDGVLPLTGVPGPVPQRPAAVVKIDNGQAAVPQTGLNAADLVIEEEVEGGVTRFAAVFHSTATIVGPVRSGRTTDLGLISGLGSPLLLYSGANEITEGILRASPTIQNRSFASSSGYWRDASRRAPSNLYSDTEPHWASASGGPPPPQFHYRQPGNPVGGTPDDLLTIGYGASPASWRWDGSRWLRDQRGAAHLVASGEQVSSANVVVIEAERVDTGMVDASGGAVPEFLFVGTGPATVFTAGRRIEGVWTRPTLNGVATLTAADGSVIGLTPGRTWIQLIEVDAGLLG